ncbi:MAG: SDR family oxidoreductase, partial [Elusimicrobia bacterium]|nr:SDR family oxidoreductase [Elusimicrobiota bacterium]
MSLAGRKALVTGASLGIGRAIGLELAAQGADVAFTFQGDAAPAESAAAAIRGLGRRAVPLDSDARSFTAAAEAVERAAGELGGLDVLVNNAGVASDAVLWKMTEEQWDRVVGVNLKGCFNHLRAAAPRFKESGRGWVVNIASINGLRGKFGQSNYCASKAGVIGLTKAAARELGPYGVNVNCVAPGMIETGMSAAVPEEFK